MHEIHDIPSAVVWLSTALVDSCVWMLGSDTIWCVLVEIGVFLLEEMTLLGPKWRLSESCYSSGNLGSLKKWGLISVKECNRGDVLSKSDTIRRCVTVGVGFGVLCSSSIQCGRDLPLGCLQQSQWRCRTLRSFSSSLYVWMLPCSRPSRWWTDPLKLSQLQGNVWCLFTAMKPQSQNFIINMQHVMDLHIFSSIYRTTSGNKYSNYE